jgi:hypothetical protein
MTLANVGVLVQCWLSTNIQKRSPHKGYRYIYVSMLVCWSLWASFFLTPFFTKTDTQNDQQTNIPTLGQNSLKLFAVERI